MSKQTMPALRAARRKRTSAVPHVCEAQFDVLGAEVAKLTASNRELGSDLKHITADNRMLRNQLQASAVRNDELKLLVSAYKAKAALYKQQACVLRGGLEVYADTACWSTNDDGENVFCHGASAPGYDGANRVLNLELVRSTDA